MISLASLTLLAASTSFGGADDEARYYTVDYLVPPAGEVLEVGGLDQLSDGRLVVSTRRGQVWLVTNPTAENPADASFSLFAEGLWEGLGLNVVDDVIHVIQRGEVTRLLDTDGDDICDRMETITSDWGLSGNYHEFAYGLPQDADGNFYMSLNVSFFSPKWWHGKSPVPYRGWILKITPEGEVVPFASGLRSPAGLSIDGEGRLLATDNQGDWLAASPVIHVQEGGFYGHPASLAWTPEYLASDIEPSDTVPPARASIDRRPAAVWLPYKWSRSPGNTATDTTQGKFGPFAGQNILAELTNGMLLRLMLEEVEGQTQGAVAIMRQNVGSSVRLHFAEDGTLFSGLTNRGWGGKEPAYGIARLHWTGETPLEVEAIRLQPAGFDLDFTLPLASGSEVGLGNVKIGLHEYDYWWEYGSPERDRRKVEVVGVQLTEDRRTLRIRTATEGQLTLEAGRVATLNLNGLVSEDGRPLLHSEIAYTINQIPGSPHSTSEQAVIHASKVVPPPPAKDAADAGWLHLTDVDSGALFESEGWEVGDAVIDNDDPTRFRVNPGSSALVNSASEHPSDYVSKVELGDAQVHIDFSLPRDGVAGLFLMGRYEVRLADFDSSGERSPMHTGGIPASPGFDGAAPEANAYLGAGQRHEIDVTYRAPRFDASGAKVENARIELVRIGGVTVQENVELPGPSPDAPFQDEVPRGPIVVGGKRSQIAMGNIQALALDGDAGEQDASWQTLVDFDEESLAGWTQKGNALWNFEDEILVGEGPMGHLFSPQTDFGNVEVLARVKIADGGNSGLYVRSLPPTGNPDSWPTGYEIQINSTFPDPQKTGSIYNLSKIPTQLIPADTWFDLRVRCVDGAEATRITVWVNDVMVNDLLDPFIDGKPRWPTGSVAFQQHHESSIIEVRSLSAKRL